MMKPCRRWHLAEVAHPSDRDSCVLDMTAAPWMCATRRSSAFDLSADVAATIEALRGSQVHAVVSLDQNSQATRRGERSRWRPRHSTLNLEDVNVSTRLVHGHRDQDAEEGVRITLK